MGLRQRAYLDEARRRKKLPKSPMAIWDEEHLSKMNPSKIPKRIMFYNGKMISVDPKVWKSRLKRARESQKLGREGNPHYREDAEKPLMKVAADGYRYFYHRAHMLSTAWGSLTPMDPGAKREWEKITGKEVVPIMTREQKKQHAAEQRVLAKLKKKSGR